MSDLDAVAEQFARDAAAVHDFVHGGPANTVETDYGSRLTLAAIEARAAAYDGRGYATYAEMASDLSAAPGTVRDVLADPDPSRNGKWLKIGAAGTGSWQPSSGDRVARLEARIGDRSGYALSVEDERGRVVLGVRDNGTLLARRVEAAVNGDVEPTGSDARLTGGGHPFEVLDACGRVALRVADDGALHCAHLVVAHGQFDRLDSPLLSRSAVPPVQAGYEVQFFPVFGQSWACGFDSVPPISVTPRYTSLMFYGGVVAQTAGETAADYTAWVPLHEASATGTPLYPGSPLGETPASGQCGMVQELLRAENAQTIDPGSLFLLSAAPGEGSRRIEELSKGTEYYARLIAQVQHGYDLAQAQGKTFALLAFSWVQNTANGGTQVYGPLLEQLRADVQADVQAITGQTEPVRLITWQYFPDGNAVNTAGDLYARHVQPAIDHPHIYCAGPSYFLDPIDLISNIHLQPVSSAWLGAYFGIVYKRIIIDGEHWSPVRPLSVRRQGRVLTVTFHVPAGRLVFDTTRVALAEHYGFNLYQGSTEIPIESVAIVQRDAVRIVTTAAVSVGSHLRYCSKGTTYGRQAGIRGNLRDTAGDTLIFDGGGLNLPMHNWCVAFDFEVS